MRVCVCVCGSERCPLSSSVKLWLNAMSDWVRPGQIGDPAANTASHYTSPPIASEIQT